MNCPNQKYLPLRLKWRQNHKTKSKLKPIKLLLLFIFNFLIVVNANAQFTEIESNLPGVVYGAVAWGDCDNDGDLDILINGELSGGKSLTSIYLNQKGVFRAIPTDLPKADIGSVAWGDYDNDGDLDVLISGWGERTGIYRNDKGRFININAQIAELQWSSAKWGDYDNDGDLDLAIAGKQASNENYVSKIYQNKNGKFYDLEADLLGVNFSTLDWGDYDNDGDLDLLLTGITKNTRSVTKIYKNINNRFSDAGINLEGTTGYGSVAWGDYDADGDLDILISKSKKSLIYRNEGGFFTDIKANLTAAQKSNASWIDYDNDGDLDVFITGYVNSSEYKSILYRNIKGNFIDLEIPFPGLQLGDAAWGDYDNDGDPDLLLTGETIDGKYISKIYRNNFSSTSFKESNAELPKSFIDTFQIYLTSSKFKLPKELWVDLDKDNDLDLVVSNDSISNIFRNDNGNFTQELSNENTFAQWADHDKDGDLDLLVCLEGKNAFHVKLFQQNETDFKEIKINIEAQYPLWAYYYDFDMDGDLDIVVVGLDENEKFIKQIIENKVAEGTNKFYKNSPPNPPFRKYIQVLGNDVVFNWKKSLDEQTPQNALTYNLRLGKTFWGAEIVNPSVSYKNNFLKIPQNGNVGSSNKWAIKNLPPGKYYWSVQAIDPAFMASPFSRIDSFEVRGNIKCVVTNTNDSGEGSLREALKNANLNYGADTIRFNIFGEAPYVIQPLSPLPKLKSKGTVIDGRTQPRFQNGIIELDGSLLFSASGSRQDTNINQNKVQILGIFIHDFPTDAIVFDDELKPDEFVSTMENVFPDTLTENPIVKEKWTKAYLGLNVGLLQDRLQSPVGLSFYYPIGLFVSGFRNYNNDSPTRTYSQAEVNFIKRNLDLSGIHYTDLTFKESRANLKTISFGFYFQAVKHLYVKAGISHINGQIWDVYDGHFNENDLQNSGNPNEYALDISNIKSNNLLLGASLVYPFFQAEAGYDLLFEKPFINIGINYPIKKIKNIFR